MFWKCSDGPAGLHRYKLRVMFDAVPMRWDWPVDVNYHEATAFAAWRTQQDGSSVAYRLITEAEHQLIRNTGDRADAGAAAAISSKKTAAVAAEQDVKPGVAAGKKVFNMSASPAAAAAPVVCIQAVAVSAPPAAVTAELDAEVANRDMAMHVSGKQAAALAGFNYQLAYGSQCPVSALAPSSAGFHDTFGNAWEWTEDHFAALEGFEVHPYYDDFSVPCFAGLHHMVS